MTLQKEHRKAMSLFVGLYATGMASAWLLQMFAGTRVDTLLSLAIFCACAAWVSVRLARAYPEKIIPRREIWTVWLAMLVSGIAGQSLYTLSLITKYGVGPGYALVFPMCFAVVVQGVVAYGVLRNARHISIAGKSAA